MLIFRTIPELSHHLHKLRQQNIPIGLVPTMGALHQGHLDLIATAKKNAEFVLATIFVNPTQFNDPKDLEKYPRTENADLQKLSQNHCDAVFIPSVAEIYTKEEAWHLEIGYLETILEGASRPGHYQGVTQIVKKLFDLVQPQKAFFGQKDYQQFLIIEFLVQHFSLPIKLYCVPTTRESDGLAMSSRNVHLSVEEKNCALNISKTLFSIQKQTNTTNLETIAINELRTSSCLQLEYFLILDAKNLQPISTKTKQKIALIAVKIGKTRLIDNILLD